MDGEHTITNPFGYLHLKPIEDSKVLPAINAGLRECEHLRSICPEMALNIDKVKWALSEKQERAQEELNKRIADLKTTIGRYWHVKEYHNDKVVDYYHIYPYALNEENNTYWFIKGYLGSKRTDHHLGLEKTHFYVQDTLNKNFVFLKIDKGTFLTSIDIIMHAGFEKYLK